MTTTERAPSLYAKETAVVIRSILKAAFPAVKFSVRKDGFATVNVSWTNGPSAGYVDELIGFMVAGNFNGMVDCYEYSGAGGTVDGERVRCGFDFIFTRRSLSDDFKARLAGRILRAYGTPDLAVQRLQQDPAAWRNTYPAGETSRQDLEELVWRLACDRTRDLLVA